MAPVFHILDFECQFIVHMDTLGRVLEAVLSQNFKDGEHPILYTGWKLLPQEQKYSLFIQKECLTIKWAVKALHYYLLGAPFTLVTDHAPLTWLKEM